MYGRNNPQGNGALNNPQQQNYSYQSQTEDSISGTSRGPMDIGGGE